MVDCSRWLEYLANCPNAAVFARPIQDSARLIVPVWNNILSDKWLEPKHFKDDAVVQQQLVKNHWGDS